eukprot:7378314-Prymnesium_polylepis.3
MHIPAHLGRVERSPLALTAQGPPHPTPQPLPCSRRDLSSSHAVAEPGGEHFGAAISRPYTISRYDSPARTTTRPPRARNARHLRMVAAHGSLLHQANAAGRRTVRTEHGAPVAAQSRRSSSTRSRRLVH